MGDKQVMWSPEDEVEVQRAEHEFNVLRAAGFHVYNQGKAVAKFDAKAGYFLATEEALAIPDEDKPKAKAKATAKVKEVKTDDAK